MKAWSHAWAVAVLLAPVLATGCGPAGPEAPLTVTTVVSAPVQGGTDGVAHEPEGEAGPADGEAPARASFERVVAALPPGTGVAIAPVGGSAPALLGGDLTSDVAWSTIKVPLALAALRAVPDVAGAVDRALTLSDNDAAESLWSALGGGERAAAAVEAVLVEAGDSATDVPAGHRRPGYSVYGQTEWPLADQARFGAGLACLPDAPAVLVPMGHVDPSQRWGLGVVPGAVFKGGWGPTLDGGGYLARQVGIVPTPGGRVAVAVVARGAGLDGAAALLTRIAESLDAELDGLPAGECGGGE